MNRKNTEKRKIEWLEVIPIAIIVISTMVVGWLWFNKAYEDSKQYWQNRTQRQQAWKKYEQTKKECEQSIKEREQKLKEMEQEYREFENK